MALERDLARARLNAAAARHNRDRHAEAYWTEIADDCELRLTLRDNPWDELKGSPDHSCVGNG